MGESIRGRVELQNTTGRAFFRHVIQLRCHGRALAARSDEHAAAAGGARSGTTHRSTTEEAGAPWVPERADSSNLAIPVGDRGTSRSGSRLHEKPCTGGSRVDAMLGPGCELAVRVSVVTGDVVVSPVPSR